MTRGGARAGTRGRERHGPRSAATSLLAALLAAGLASRASAQSPAPAAAPSPAVKTAQATFAGGCFWCMEPPFDKIDGVVSTTSGYTGGTKKNPTYEEVSAGGSGHAESVEVVYDPTRVTYEELLDVFWHNVDPLTPNAQFCDHGDQYRTAVFHHDGDQKRAAEKSKKDLESSGRFKQPIVTQIVEAGEFWPAEDYHQDYYEKNPVRYQYYRYRCGRDQRLEELWGKPK